jgi:hypothetical protein
MVSQQDNDMRSLALARAVARLVDADPEHRAVAEPRERWSFYRRYRHDTRAA